MRLEIAETPTAIGNQRSHAPHAAAPAGARGSGFARTLHEQRRQLQRMVDNLLARFPELRTPHRQG